MDLKINLSVTVKLRESISIRHFKADTEKQYFRKEEPERSRAQQ